MVGVTGVLGVKTSEEADAQAVVLIVVGQDGSIQRFCKHRSQNLTARLAQSLLVNRAATAATFPMIDWALTVRVYPNRPL
jgi:hypothetical protein